MNFNESLEYLNSFRAYGSKLGLDRLRKLLNFLNNPQKKLKYVHIAGTNGKGSTSSFIFHILKEAGFRAGLFTSPYIQKFNERIQVGNQQVSDDEVCSIIANIKFILENKWKDTEFPTWFEILTAMCFVFFENQNCDIVVLEVGMGGDLDSTNVIDDSLVSVITSISYDHMEVLGNTLEEISSKKAGIIKQNGRAIIYPQGENVINVIKNYAKEKNAITTVLNVKDIKHNKNTLDGQVFDYKEFKNLNIKMLGTYQVTNACVAVETILTLIKMGFKITEKNIRDGLYNTTWPGRLEIVNKNPLFLLDGAHNVGGATNLAHNLKLLCPNDKFIFIVGVLQSKDYKNMLEDFFPLANSFITVTPDNKDKALSGEDLHNFLKEKGAITTYKNSVSEAISYALNISDEKIKICSFGSLYYIGQVRDYFGLY
ncbi:MAG: bifunctional folylpolyglutamate synthase/dihydrofolate synthase [Defluviitaleaceae bacterium]|nr:bifunctional folylpolyglutamate synthase/dihydrofolate synthase [Defluviitaleaceae bacterium]